MEKRLEILREKMITEGLDGVFITSKENRFYLSNFRGTSGALLITKDENYLFTDFRYIDQAKIQSPMYQVINHQRDLYSSVSDFVKKHFIAKLGIEYETLPINEYLILKNKIPSVAVEPVNSLLYGMRMIKDEIELQNLKNGIEICDKAFSHILTFIRPGITEKDIGLELEIFMRKAGAEGIKENHVIASGERSSLPHGQATERIINYGDFVKMDYGAKVNGYLTDFTRTVVVGQPNDKQLEIYNIVKTAQNAALNVIGPGVISADVDNAARSIISKAGYGDNFGHSTGHSIGLAIHEMPTLRANDQTILQPGMVVTIEPGIYIPGFGGVRIEDLVVITENGYENLTKSTKELQIIAN